MKFRILDAVVFYMTFAVFRSSASQSEPVPEVTKIEPNEGSMAGNTMVYIHGKNLPESLFKGLNERTIEISFKSQFHDVPCNIVPTDVSENRVACETGENSTPTITKIVNRTMVPGTLIAIHGKIFARQFSRLQSDFDPKNPEITRIFAGSDTCESFDPEAPNNTIYGSEMDPYTKKGWFICKPRSQKVASNDIAYIVSGKGISIDADKTLYLVDWTKKLYLYQTHADIKSVSPSSGSVMGGTLVTITGVGFGTKKENAKVKVAGAECKIQTISAEKITCITDKQPDTKTFYAGNRGLLREIWKTSPQSTLTDIDSLTSSAADYHTEYLTNASSPEVTSFNKSSDEGYSSKISGYFRVPWDDNYRFYIRCDDKCELHINTSGDPNNKAKVAECKSYTNKWNKYSDQRSSSFALIKGQHVYIHALHTDYKLGHYVSIGVSMENVPHANVKIGGAVDEKQQIKTSSVALCEKQIINMTGWNSNETTQEIQQIELPTCGQSGQPACNQTFTLHYKGVATSPLPLNTDANNLKQALNGLSTISSRGQVTVSLVTGSTFKVEYSFSDPNDVELLTSTSSSGTTIKIQRKRTGASTKDGFKLRYGGAVSKLINSDTVTTEDGLKTILTEFFSVECNRLPTSKELYSNSFEKAVIGREYGQRMTNEIPYCGRTAMKNPTYMWRDGYTETKAGKKEPYIVNKHKFICFAYRGNIHEYISYKILYTGRLSSVIEAAWRGFKFGREAFSNKWRHVCFNLYDIITNDKTMQARAKDGSTFKISYAYFRKDPKRVEDFFVDELWIGNSEVVVTPTTRPSMPNGHLIESFSVTKLSTGRFSVCMTPVMCGSGLPLFGIEGSRTNVSDLSNNATYKYKGLQSSVQVEREQSATPPITGTFDATYEGKTVKGIPANATAAKLKQLLEERFDVGDLDVQRTGSCSAYTWTITWTSKGGNHPQLAINGSLSGNQPSVLVQTIADGHLLLGPIPGEFLRTPHNKSQVDVTINGIPSSCFTQNCTYEYADVKTPKLTSLSKSTLKSGDSVTLTGTGFSTDSSLLSVTIGGVLCNITSSTETTITCTSGNAPGGMQPVIAHCKGRGNARYSSSRRRRSVSVISDMTVQVDPFITNVTPLKGSTAGGTELTIKGTGFNTDKSTISVTLDGSVCDITSTTTSAIKCITAEHVVGSLSVSVSISGYNSSNTKSYTYDAALTPTVTTVSPLTGKVSGNEVMIISGSGFGTDMTIVVKLGTDSCKLQSVKDTEIKCTTPAHKPGKVPITVTAPGKGYASIPSSYNSYEYILKVDGISPLLGSITGGTEVTITGSGFSNTMAENVVKIGSKDCKVTSSNATTIKCVTQDNFKTVKVNNFGTHPDFGKGYAWNPSLVEVNIGDKVEWEWSAALLAKIQYQVFQTEEDSDVYDESGFKSPKSGKGSFSHQFVKAGTYYYSSGPMGDDGSVVMRGKVEVEPIQSQEQRISVKVAGVPAACSATAQPATSSSACDKGVTTAIPGCQTAELITAASQPVTCLSFTYKKCHTPIVTEVTPNKGTSQQVITIKGKGFSVTQCQNVVTFGSHACTIISNSETTLTCKIDVSSKPKPGVPLELSLVVKNRGKAFIQADQQAKTNFALLPRVASVTPSSGSQGGGTRLTLSGDGFSETLAGNTVLIGTASCAVKTATYTTITCVTAPQPSGSNGPLDVIVDSSGTKSNCTDAKCKFTYSPSKTPKVDGTQDIKVTGPNHTLTLTGSGFGTSQSDVSVTVGDVNCVLTELLDNKIKCRIPAAFAGEHQIKVLRKNNGLAVFNFGVNSSVKVEPSISGISPSESSTEGGLNVEITGFGFNTNQGQTSITVKSKQAAIVSATITKLVFTTPANAAGNAQVVIESGGSKFPSQQITYSSSATAEITAIQPTIAASGQTVTLSGTFPGATLQSSKVKVGDWSCDVTAATTSEIKCTVPTKPAGKYPVSLVIVGKGKAKSSVEFSIDLSLTSVLPKKSGHGGGRVITVKGSGFSSSTVVKICNKTCIHSKDANVTDTQISCEVPQSDDASHGSDSTCAVTVSVDTFQKTLSAAFTYKQSMTSVVTSVRPSRGGTGGGVILTIKGSGFNTTLSDNVVTIDGTACTVKSATATEITCETGAHKATIKTHVRVEVGSNGKAVGGNDEFYYVDVWSSIYSWGGNPPPKKGEFVVISKGQTMVLDIDTPVLKIIVINGGTFIFDDEKDIHLQSEYIFITNGGKLQIGTEAQPFTHKATITMHGHVRSKELPVYGAKGIGLREGTIDIHGKHMPITWTRLSQTEEAGATEIHLQLKNTWEVGDEIVIAATGRSERENEKVKITQVLDGGQKLKIDPPLKYKHISIAQTIASKTIETRAEVGLLTRNVVIQGSIQDEWTEKIEACPKEFRPGQFQTQTCFQGKFGDEIGSDQFGVQILIHAPTKSNNLVTARFSYIEVRHAGQAFRLGRYPIHFHTSGRIDGSYVIGCAIHRSFSRAITMHGVHNLVVQHNVVYDVMGNALFMEDGIEQGNTVQYNLGIFVKPSSSSLNVDITPATFWVTNANNTVRDNAAAGGTHFGFWYQMFEHPDGPSFTPHYCPRNVPMKVYENNTAHSFGRYGLWVFPTYHPMKVGGCNSKIAQTAFFDSLVSWNNMRGAEIVDGGAVAIRNSTMLDNDIAGIEIVHANAKDSPWGGAMIKDTLIISHSAVNSGGKVLYTESGIRTPQTHGLLVTGVTFVNFNEPGCGTAAIQCCSQCANFHKKGGFETRFEKMAFDNSPCRTRFQWQHETVLRDMDGSMTSHAGGFIVPTSGHLPTGTCKASAKDSHGQVPGSICDNTINFRRFAMNKALPKFLEGKIVQFNNKFGAATSSFQFKDQTHKFGWMATLITNLNYTMTFVNASHITNITYSAAVFDAHPSDRIIINHQLLQEPDHFETIGKFQNMIGTPPGADDPNGAWSFDNTTRVFTYQFSGKDNPTTVNGNYPPRNVNLKVYRCYFLKCVAPTPPPPPKGRPAEFQVWSKPSDWSGTESGYGGYGGVLPKDGDNVKITSKMWMVLDIQPASLNKVLVEGVLEIDGPDGIVLNATYIFVTGSIIVGWSDKPYPRNFMVNLRGSWSSKDNPISNAPNAGTKALAVFGNMYFHGKPRKPYWTKLSTTATNGSNSIVVTEAVDWVAGDEILITSTTKEPRQTEIFKILSIAVDKKTITLDGTLKFKHKAVTHTTGKWTYTLAAEVGILTRNIKIVGAEDSSSSIEKQSFGCRVLVSTYSAEGKYRIANAKIENVEFKNCGQLGWTDSYDPRYSLALHALGDVTSNTSYIRGNSIHHGFNIGIGLFSTNNIVLEDNIIYYTAGPSIRDEGKGNTLIHNLAVRSEGYSTFRGQKLKLLVHWPGAIENHLAENPVLINNTVAGSDRMGYKTDGEVCTGQSRWHGNEVHGAWHGIHLSYREGQKGCCKFSDFLIWENCDYGIFAYAQCSLNLSNIRVIDNLVNIFPVIWGPKALDHVTDNKFLILRDSLIVGTSPGYECSDNVIPEARKPYGSDLGARPAPGGGRIGITLPFFSSGAGKGPSMAWEKIMNYPALYGNSKYERVTCSNFGRSCGKRDMCIVTNEWVGDIIHPLTVSEMSKESVESESLLHFIQPSTKWINPSDCVDMDCDANRQIVVTDFDGTLTGSGVKTTLISKAEYQWDGDSRYGLGDYRIPKTALTAVDGSRLDVSATFPNKGIIRGTKTHNKCAWKASMNGYQCTGLDHLMLIVESLDADTETRRLSPVSLAADGYVNLLNGPMDHGWCLGYTCQERISTFYGIVAANNVYSLYFSSTEPQKLRFHLLNSDESQVVRIEVFYMKPQRKDVYKNGLYMYPANADMDAGQFSLKNIPKGAAKDHYYPPLAKSISGANYFDNDRSTLLVVVRGPTPVDIHTSPVVQITISVKEVTVDDFFKTNLIQNLAALLGCDPSLIRFMKVISASGSRRRRRAVDGEVQLVVQIANPPVLSTNTTNSTASQNSTASSNSSSIDQLNEYAAKTVDSVQSGALVNSMNGSMEVTGLKVDKPIAPPVDPTGGVHATNVTGGSANVTNGTLTYAQKEAQESASSSIKSDEYSIPCKLVLGQQPSGANETVAFKSQPRLKIVDCSGKLVTSLGDGSSNWTLTAKIRQGTGDGGGTINGTVTIEFDDGWANFTDLSISHSASSYVLEFYVSKPSSAKFDASSQPFEVKERQLYFTVTKQPCDAIEETVFAYQPAVEVRDTADGKIVTNTGWKGRKWLFTAALVSNNNNQGKLSGKETVEFVNGVATFTDLTIDIAGLGYKLDLTVKTSPESNYKYTTQSNKFEVRSPFAVLSQKPGNCNSPHQLNVRMSQPYITSSTDCVQWAGINTSSLLEATLSYENGTKENIGTNHGQVVFDWVTEANGLFTVEVKNGVLHVVGNSASKNGIGYIVAKMANNTVFRLKITVVGFSGVELHVKSYPEIPGSPDVTLIKQISLGIFQKVLLKFMLKLSDNTSIDISSSTNSTISVINSAEVANAYTVGPSPSNLFTFKGNGYNGALRFKAEFAGCASSLVNTTVSSTLVSFTSIVKFSYNDVDQTFSDFEKATRSVTVDLKTSDGILIRFDQSLHGRVKFTASKPSVVDVDNVTGSITLLSNANEQVVLMAMLVSNPNVNASVTFYANPKPSQGQVDIGEELGSAIPELNANQVWKLAVRVNPGSVGLLAIEVQITFDVTSIEYISTETNLAHDITGNVIHIFSSVSDADAASSNVAMVSFKALKAGRPTITLQSYTTVDKTLEATPTRVVGPCSASNVLGDVNIDCVFDVVDMAFLKGYFLSAQKGFTDNLGATMKSVTTSQKKAMDVDMSNDIDEDDFRMLALAFLEKVRFLSDFTIVVPDHNRNQSNSCELQIKVKLKSKSGQYVDGSKTEIYLDIAHKSSTVHDQLQGMSLSKGTKAATKNTGGILKASYDSQSQMFKVSSAASKLSGTDIGISIVQVVTDNTGKKTVSPMVRTTKSTIYPSGLDVAIGSNLRLHVTSGYSPQRMIEFKETTEECEDPYELHIIELIFEGDFKQLTSEGEDSLIKAIYKALLKLGFAAEFKCTGIREGSIIANITMKVVQSKKDSVVDALYKKVVEGISVTHNGQTIITTPYMKVGDKEYNKEKQVAPAEKDLSTTYIIIIVVVVCILVLVVIIIIVYVKWRNMNKNKKIKQIPSVTPDNCWDHDDELDIKKHKYEVNDACEDDQSIQSLDAMSENIAPRRHPPSPRIERAFTNNPVVTVHSESPSSSLDDSESDEPDNESRMAESESSMAVTQRAVSPRDVSPRSVTPVPPMVVVEEDYQDAAENGSTTKLNSELLIAPAFEFLDETTSKTSPNNSRQGSPTPSLPNAVDDGSEEAFTPVTDESTVSVRQVLYKKLQVSLIRSNIEMGTVAHFVGVVNANVLGTLEELRKDVNLVLPRHLSSKKYLFVNKRMELIETWREVHMIVKTTFTGSIRIKTLYGTDRSEDFCPCGSISKVWCNNCKVQGYCSEDCRDSDAISHVITCKRNKSKQKLAMSADRMTMGKV